jgi:hypothetical protein
MTLANRTQALLDLVESDRIAQCSAILTQAQTQAATLLAEARGAARSRMREAFAEERQRARSAVATARAQLQTRRRLHEQRHAAAWLAMGWEALPGALRARWQDPAARRLWVDRTVQAARQSLRPGLWRVVHAAGLHEAEQQALAAQLQQALGTAPELKMDPALEAGLRIAADGNVIDATQAGLLSDRAAVGSGLLGSLEATP